MASLLLVIQFSTKSSDQHGVARRNSKQINHKMEAILRRRIYECNFKMQQLINSWTRQIFLETYQDYHQECHMSLKAYQYC